MMIFLVATFAACIGSFASFISYRMANEESIFAGRSQCVKCSKNLNWYNLIPIFSWLIQNGKCSFCKVKISIRYPLIELTFIGAFLIIFFAFGQEINTKTILLAAITTILIIISIIDLESFFIPDNLQYLLVILGTFLNIHLVGTNNVMPLLIPALYYAALPLGLLVIFYVITKKQAIGIDDIKFLFICGFLLGTNKLMLFAMILGFASLINGVIWLKIKKERIFPFAPALCIALFTCLLMDKSTDPEKIISRFLVKFFLDQEWFTKISWYWY